MTFWIIVSVEIKKSNTSFKRNRMDKYVRNRISINRIFIDRKKKVMDAFYKTNVIVQLSFIKKHIQPYIYTHFITSILIRFSKFIVNLNDLNDIFIFIESIFTEKYLSRTY